MNGFLRWVKFSFVGLIGVGVQLCALFCLIRVARVNYLVATVLAVGCAVMHNFTWHQRFTWRDRGRTHFVETLERLFRFNTGNGAISLVGNLILMRLLVGQLHSGAMLANVISIAVCALANFVVSDRWVFVTTREGAASRAILCSRYGCGGRIVESGRLWPINRRVRCEKGT